ncbi:MAG: MazG family protein [Mycobacteriaceae bacterium]
MTVVLLDPRRPDVVPLAALALLRDPVQVTSELVPGSLQVVARAEVLVSSQAEHPEVLARVAAGERVVAAAQVPGEHLLDAVAVMDRLRSPGGCPWDAEQTHDSLRRYLVEECYELLDALEQGVRADVLEELGDVLLQVLFHARIAAEGFVGSDEGGSSTASTGFSVDDVADALVAKLVHRHPHVFATAEDLSVQDQEQRWEELKAVEKQRGSAVDGVALAQPSLALAAKLVSRAQRAGLPAELVPTALSGVDGSSEDALRRAALAFATAVRTAETAAGGGTLTPEQWRAHWPH